LGCVEQSLPPRGLRTVLPFIWDSQSGLEAVGRLSRSCQFLKRFVTLWIMQKTSGKVTNCMLPQHYIMSVFCRSAYRLLQYTSTIRVVSRSVSIILVLLIDSSTSPHPEVVAGFHVGVQKIQIKSEILAGASKPVILIIF